VLYLAGDADSAHYKARFGDWMRAHPTDEVDAKGYITLATTGGNPLHDFEDPDSTLGLIEELKGRGETWGLVVVDTLASWAPSADLNNDETGRRLANNLGRVAEELGAPVLVATWATKASGRQVWQRVDSKGGTDFLGSINHTVGLREKRPKGKKKSVLFEVNKDRLTSNLSGFELTLNERGTLERVAALPQEATGSHDKAEPKGQDQQLLSYLREHPEGATKEQIATALDLKETSVGTRLSALKAGGHLALNGKVWSLKGGSSLPTLPKGEAEGLVS